MFEPESRSPYQNSFPAFLRSSRKTIIFILLLALILRVVLAVWFPASAGDESRYTLPALNVLHGHGFSSDLREPYSPTMGAVPLYPLFITALFGVFGEHTLAVRIAQGLLDLLTSLLVAFVSFSLAPAPLRSRAAISSFAIYACLSWFTVFWTRYVLTETLALFLTMLAIAVGITAFKRGGWSWAVAGSICGLALMTRPDSLLLVVAFVLLLALRFMRHRSALIIGQLLLFSTGLMLTLAPWTLRNYLDFRQFQPLASEYGFANGGYMPRGYLQWIRTWITDETYFDVFLPAFRPGSQPFDPLKLPSTVFDSPEEREQVLQLMARYEREREFTPEINEGFAAIASARIRREPLRFFVWLPLKRILSVWLTGFATNNRLHRLVRMLMVVPILIGGLAGFMLCVRNRLVSGLLVLVVLTRTVFLGYHYAPESRYIVEAYPAMIAACGVTCAILWCYLHQRFRRDRTFPEKESGEYSATDT
ncbi:MAG: hypothetical protein QOH42_2679 [Blastocatellia bacterium]|nr:hypothetical protein [Blastocatellia bacterium]